jgi:hypothetical protein
MKWPEYFKYAWRERECLVRNPEGKRPPTRPKLRLEDNSKLDLEKKTGECGFDITG